MEPENQSPQPEELPLPAVADSTLAAYSVVSEATTQKFRWLRWIFIGSQGLRVFWSVLVFITLYLVFVLTVGTAFLKLHLISMNWQTDFTASTEFFMELILFLSVVGAASLVALIERRRSLLVFNLTGPRLIPHFLSGLAAGFAALSLLVGALAWVGWIHIGPISLTGAEIFKFGAIWAVGFLLVGCVEEGIFRCYLQFTLTRGINFWWALGIIGAICLEMLLSGKGNGVAGVYGFACLMLHIRKIPRSGFWQAAWVTSTLFAFVHTFNAGETWVGITQVALIGFVFCVSVWVTGSAWWAIGCHAAWDWAETFFYGTADSGHAATGHYLTTSPSGNALWSGGADGPEGSLLVVPVILLLLLALLVIYGRRKSGAPGPDLEA
jgi:hypothetical protein